MKSNQAAIINNMWKALLSPPPTIWGSSKELTKHFSKPSMDFGYYNLGLDKIKYCI